jgi:predicted MFS family arabinose efflux permease
MLVPSSQRDAPGQVTYADVLRMRHIGQLLAAAFLGRLAEQMFALTIVLYVLTVYSSPQLAGAAVLISAVPGLVVSPVAGALLDRMGPVPGIAADLMASTVLVAALAFAARPGTLGAALLLALAGLFSLTSPLSLAGARTLLPRLVPPLALERANALDAGCYNVIDVLGPVLAGVLFTTFGGRAAMLVIAALYAAAWLVVLRLPADAGRSSAGPASARSPLAREALDGLRYVLSDAVLRGLAVSYGLCEVALGILVVAVPFAVAGTAEAARAHGAKVGLLWAITGVAGIASVLFAGRVVKAGRERAAIMAGLLLMCLAGLVLAFGRGAGLVPGLLAVGLAAGPVDVGLLTLRQRRSDPDRLGRALAVSISLNIVGAPIGSAIGGYLIGSTGSAMVAFIAAALAGALGLLAGAILLPRGGLATGFGRPAGS